MILVSRTCSRFLAVWGATLGIAMVLPTVSPAQQREGLPSVSPELEKVRTALEKYRDPVVAVHDGYFSTIYCVEVPKAGAPGHVPYVPGRMGIHLFNVTNIGPVLDPLKPQVLLYEPRGDKLELTGAEWFVPLALVKERPTLFGHPFDGPMEGHHPLMPPELAHWDLHVWLWKENPLGMFSATNPAVTCPPGPYVMSEEAPKLVSPPR